MNLNKILKSLENLNNEHALINSKFSSSHRKGYVYKKCLGEDELEDMRIYGHTHADTISQFKLKHRNSAHLISSQKNMSMSFIEGPKSVKVQQKQFKRSQTAHKYRRPNKVLQIYTKSGSNSAKSFIKKNSLFFDQSIAPFDISNNKEHVVNKNIAIRRKSINKFKKQFNETFESDLKSVKLLVEPKRIKYKAKTVIVDSTNDITLSIHEPHTPNNFFALTQGQASNQVYKKSKLNKGEQLEIIKMLNNFIFSPFSTVFMTNLMKNGKRTWTDLWSQLKQVPDFARFRFYLVSTSNLTIDAITKENLREIESILKTTLKDQQIAHFYILKETENNKFQLVYEEYMISQSSTLNYLDWPKLLFRYFLKRFILLGCQNMTIVDANIKQKQLFENYSKVPRKFYKFIHCLKEKPAIFVDYRLNRRCGTLSQVLEEGFKQIETRRLSWNKKGTRFEHRGKENKLNRNREQIYFYICFVLLNYILLVAFRLTMCITLLFRLLYSKLRINQVC